LGGSDTGLAVPTFTVLYSDNLSQIVHSLVKNPLIKYILYLVPLYIVPL
jgi:hypothetical protein